MPKIDLVRAIIRYNPINFSRNFVQGAPSKNQSARYLLLQKAKDANPENNGKWECAGGAVERGETSEQAITREVKEETGLEFRLVKKLPTIRNCDIYLIDAASMNINLSPEHSDYRWMKAGDIQKQDLVAYADLLLEFFNNPEKYLD